MNSNPLSKIGKSLNSLFAKQIKTPDFELVRDYEKNSQKEIIKLEEKYKTIFENTRDCIVILNTRGIITDISPNVKDLFGYTREEVINKRFTKLNIFLKENFPQILKLFKNTLNTKKVEPLSELKIKNKQGKIITIETSTKLIKNNNKIEQIISIVRDVSNRKKTEKKLKDSEDRFREITNALPEIIFELDLSGKLTWVNQKAYDAFQYPPQDIANGLYATQTLIPADSKRVMNNINDIVQGKTTGIKEYTAKRKDKSTFPVLTHSTPITQNGKIQGILGIMINISERKKAEKEKEKLILKLKNTNEFTEKLLSAPSTGISTYDSKGNCKLANKSICNMIGATKQQMLSQNFKNIQSWKDSGLLKLAEKTLKTGISNQTEMELKTTFGKLVVFNCTFTQFTSKNEAHLLLMVEDISERKKIENEKQELQKRLKEYSQKLESKVKKLEKNKIGLSKKEKLVLYGLCQYPQDNDRTLSEKLNLNRSTITAIKNRLLEKNYYRQTYVPTNKELINCNLMVVIYGTIHENVEPQTIKKLFTNINFFNLQVSETEFVGILSAENLTNAHKQINKLLKIESELNILKNSPQISYLPCNEENIHTFLDYSQILRKIFEITHEKQKTKIIKYTKKKLSTNLKEIIYTLSKYPYLSSQEIAKKLRLARATVTNAKKTLIQNGILKKIIQPNFKKLNCELLSLTHTKFPPNTNLQEIHKQNNMSNTFMSISGMNEKISLQIFSDYNSSNKSLEQQLSNYTKQKIKIEKPQILNLAIKNLKIDKIDFSQIIKEKFKLHLDF